MYKLQIEDIMKCFGMEEYKLVNTPFDDSSKLCKIDKPMIVEEANGMKGILYKETIGCLMYVMITTRSNIDNVIKVVNKSTKLLQLPNWAIKKYI
jgi:hypothetical protein